MSRSYKYAIAQFADDSARNERLNIGLVIFDADTLDVKVSRSIDKIRAMSFAVNVDLIRESIERLRELDSYFVAAGADSAEARIDNLREVAAVSLSQLGTFYADSNDAYQRIVQSLFDKLVEPEPSLLPTTRRRPSKLLTSVKIAFATERVLARKGEDLSAHRIISNYKLAEGLPADLILKNGAMHVVQTVDGVENEGAIRKFVSNVAVSALIFEQARMTFGDANTIPRLVYQASSVLEASMKPSLDAAQHQGARLINWESRDDRTRFIIELSSLAEPLADGASKSINVHASVQPKFKLN